MDQTFKNDLTDKMNKAIIILEKPGILNDA